MKTLTAFCDLKFCPVSYDFVVWLVRAMMERDVHGCDHLHVVIIPHEGGIGGFARDRGDTDEAYLRWRLWHIVMASIPLAGATVTLSASIRRAHREIIHGETWIEDGRTHLDGPIIAAGRNGIAIPKLRATDAARRYVAGWFKPDEEIITLTLRDQGFCAERNSNFPAWQELEARIASSTKYRTAWLFDSEIAIGCDGGSWAEIDPDMRLALYERASMNIVGNNGPAALLWHSGAPYMRIGCGIPADWARNIGLAKGEQIPWATKDQICVYAPDTFEAMLAAFEKWESA